MEMLGKTILLVEDESLIALSEKRELERAGYGVVHSLTGEGAIRFVDDNPAAVDLILMDIDLGPGIDGTKAAQEILRTHDIPVVFLSSHVNSETVKRTEEITNYGYVVKSSAFTVLDASIKMAFKLYHAKKLLDIGSLEITSAQDELRKNFAQLQDAYAELSLRKAMKEKIFRLSPDAICVTRLSDGVYKDVNQSFTRLLGYTREEALGHSCFSGDLGIWIHQEERKRLADKLHEEAEGITFEMEFRRKDGTIIMTSTNADLMSFDGEECVISSMREISASGRGESEFGEIEDRYRLLFEEAGAGILIYDPDLKVLDANKKSVLMFDYPKEELCEKTLYDLDPDLADRMILEERTEGILGSGPYTFSAKRRRKDGSILPVEVNAMPIVWRDKPAVMAIIHDMAERVEREREYDREHAILQSTLEIRNDVLMVGIDKNFTCLFLNKSYHDEKESLFGVDIRVGDCLLDNLPKDVFLERSLHHFRRALAGESIRVYEEYEELGMAFDAVFNPIRGRHGEILGAAALSIDISERMALEKKIRKEEERFRLAMEASKDAIWDLDIADGQVYFSPAYSEMLRYDSDEMKNFSTWPACFHSDEFIELSPIFQECIEGRRENFEVQYRAALKDGTTRWLNVCGKVVERDLEGRARRLLGTVHDISELKDQESELHEKKAQLKLIGDNIPAVIAILDADSFRYQYVNRGYEKLYGLSNDQMIGMTMQEVIGESNFMDLTEYIEELRQGKSVSFERLLSLEKSARWAQVNWIPLLNEQRGVERFLLLAIDITDLRKATEALRFSEERFRLAMDAAEEGIWDYDLAAEEIYYSPAFYQTFGYTEEEIGIVGRHKEYVHPDDREMFLAALEACIENRKDSFELDYRIRTKQGSWRWINTRAKVVARNDAGKATRMIGTIVDITGRKGDEEKIRELSHEFRMILDTAPIGIAKIVDKRFTWINKAISDLLCYSNEELDRKEVSLLFPSVEAFDAAYGRMIKSISEGDEPFQQTQELLRGDGQHSTFYISGNAVDPSDPSKGIILAGEDITRQKQLEEKLVASEAKYRALFKAVSDALCIIDRKSGSILDCNEAAERMFGYTREDIIGFNFMATSLDSENSQVGAIANHNLIPLRYHRRRDGTAIPLEIATSLLRLEGRDVIVAAMRDISSRIEAEQEIRKLLHEKELILREVHHRIKNNLQVLASILSIRVANSGDEKANVFLNEAICEIESMSLLYDKLYRTEYTGTMPIRMYLPELMTQAVQVFGEEKRPNIETEIEDIALDAGLLSRLGIVINELVTNSMKYAFADIVNPTIFLRVSQHGSKIHLEYEDNGRGLPASFSAESTGGFGMQLILAMMQQIGGSMRAETRKGAIFAFEIDV